MKPQLLQLSACPALACPPWPALVFPQVKGLQKKLQSAEKVRQKLLVEKAALTDKCAELSKQAEGQAASSKAAERAAAEAEARTRLELRR